MDKPGFNDTTTFILLMFQYVGLLGLILEGGMAVWWAFMALPAIPLAMHGIAVWRRRA